MIPGKDGLDDWLDREVRPLPPPAGTFELITKRARRRKVRKLAVTLTSAAAVAAAAVFAVPTVLTLHLSPTHETGVAAGSTSKSATPSASASASTPSPTPTAGPTQAQGTGTPGATGQPSGTVSPASPAGGPVPANFQPTSVTFVSAYEGWTIGQAGTPGTCANADPTICTSMARTNDRGKTWTGVPAPNTKLVSGIRFLDGINGWAFGPQLWYTHDRGNTWTQADTHGQEVIGLETGGKVAFAVFATCGNTTTTDLSAANCTSYTLEATPAGTDNWTPVGPATTGLSNSGNAGSGATIVLGNGGAWLLGPDGTVYNGPDTGGGSWHAVGKAPCAPTRLLSWVKSSQSLITGCSTQAPSSGGQQVATSLFTSADGGLTWSAADTAGSSGFVTSLSGSPNAPVILATTSGIDVRTSAGHEKQVTALQGGFSYVGMTGDNQGVAVPADAALHEIWMTYDGGLQWSAAKVST